MTILFISAFDAPFIRDDLETLKKHFIVNKQIDSGIWAAVKILFRVINVDVVFCWFASVYAFIGVALGKIFGIKSIIVIGGVDAAKDKHLRYGIWLSRWKSVLVRYAVCNVTYVLVGDYSLKQKLIDLAEYDGGNILYVPPGFDTSYWKLVGEKEPFVLTVASANEDKRLLVKGIPILVETARQLKDVTFIVIGVDPALAFKLEPPFNMTFYASMERKDLLPFYQRAKVYCQPSIHEAVSYTVREAMLCGCIPVTTAVGGMQTAVADIGILVPPNDSAMLANAIREALQMDESIGRMARARIVSLFPKEKREAELLRIIEKLKG
ncbi:MAG: glycosyltransferase family 4 protein [Bacteroidota bacterium]|nr:glycosyltransferase family 4 protein [Bacteroidota bacterium]